jgi:cell pole-organizing protein PopZ
MEIINPRIGRLSAEGLDALAQRIAADFGSRIPVDTPEHRLAFEEAASFYSTAAKLIVMTSSDGDLGSQIKLAATASRALAKAISAMFSLGDNEEKRLYEQLIVDLLRPVTK